MRGGRGVAFCFSMFFAFAVGRDAHAGALVKYIGQSCVHLDFGVDAPNVVLAQYLRTAPGGTEQVMASGAPLLAVRQSDPAPVAGVYTYKFRVITRLGPTTYATNTTVEQATVDGLNISGNPVFDDTLVTNALIAADVQVGTGLTMRVNGNLGTTGGSLEIHGAVRFAPEARVGCPIRLFAPQVISGVGSVNYLDFRPGSEGSQVFSSTGFTAFISHDQVDFSTSSNFTLQTSLANFSVNEFGGPMNMHLVFSGGTLNANRVKSGRITFSGSQLNLSSSSNCVLNIESGQAISISWCDIPDCEEIGLVGTIEVLNTHWRGRAVRFQGATTLYGMTNDAALTVESGPFAADRSVFNNNLSLYNCPTGKVSFRDCLFRSAVSIEGGGPSFERCSFLRPTGLFGLDEALRFVNRSAARIENSIFVGPIRFYNAQNDWMSASSPTPIIQNNGFVGPSAFLYLESSAPQGPIPIGPNYYGDRAGPVVCVPSVGYAHGFLGANYDGRGGAMIHDWDIAATPQVPRNLFQIAPPLPRRPADLPKDTTTLPFFWLNDWIVGQNTVPHRDHGRGAPMLQGRETLLSLDLATSDYRAKGIRVYADFDGQQIEATPERFISRDRGDYAEKDPVATVMAGVSTINLVLPPVTSTSAVADVYLDLSGIQGYDGAPRPAPTRILRETFTFTPAPAGVLRLAVIPIRMKGIFSDWPTPDATKVHRMLEDGLPAMLPIPAHRVEVWTAPDLTIQTGLGTAISSIGLANCIAAHLELCRTIAGWCGPTQAAHFAVAVMPEDSLHTLLGYGVAEGLNFTFRRGTILVDGTKPLAALHELGHAIGLFTGSEQYSWWNGGSPGWQAAMCSAFWTEPTSSKAHPGFKGARVMHYPGPTYNWYDAPQSWYDIMSEANDQVWPIQSTLDQFATYFATLPPAAAPAAPASVRSASLKRSGPAAGYRRVLFQGLTEPIWAGEPADQFIAGTIGSFDMTLLPGDLLPAATTGWSETVHDVKGLDADGVQVFSTEFRIPSNLDPLWYMNWDIPDTVREYVFTRRYDAREVWRKRALGTLATRLDAPASGTVLGNEFTARWTSSATDDPRGTNLLHMLLFSTDGGATWQTAGHRVRGTNETIRTDFLPATGALILRLVTSDGFTSVESRVAGLSVGNRAPRPKIDSPLDGAEASTGTVWRLSGFAHDIEDGILTNGTWSSSRDGVLGQGMQLDGIVLSPGVHTIRLTVTDSGGSGAFAECTVTVRLMVNVDLKIDADALAISGRGDETVDELPPLLLYPGRTNHLSVRVANQGCETHYLLGLYAEGPGLPLTLIGQREGDAGPFETIGLTTPFAAAAMGDHRIHAVLDLTQPPDRNPADNQRSWTVPTRMPQLGYSPAFVEFRRGLSPGWVPGSGGPLDVVGTLTLSNPGLNDLHLGALSITGTNTTPFTIVSNGAAATLPIGGSRKIWLNYRVPAVGVVEANLVIPSDDPDSAQTLVPLRGIALYPDGWQDTDRDGILDVLETRNGTSLSLADTDGDGLNDGVEDRNRNGIVDDGETSPLLRDTDGDGLEDGTEDANRDGHWDYEETHPRFTDSDGDGVRDGAELSAGTNPLSEADVLGMAWVAVSGSARVRWHAKAGKTYQVLRSGDLRTWADAPNGGAPVQQGRQTAVSDGLLEYADPQNPGSGVLYYRVELK